ncbi:hypothetical protein WJX72_011083 [[Myrmecia] bisecta]|uniref:EF-hand domain-containing protein n=1 Tax=[Myrmecia] bisecta TaxID=41462 RepID=A0AAW1P743_9CHLO
MPGLYQQQLGIPPGFPAILKALARETLRAQPDNIYEFAARYFLQLVEDQKHGGGDYGDDAETGEAGGNRMASLSNSELEELVMQLFVAADKDNNGYLDRAEFKAALRSSDLNLSTKQIRWAMEEADENANGVVEYREFVPIMVQILQAMQAKEAALAAEQAIAQQAETLLLHGMPQAELEALILRTFQKSDTDGSGTLDRAEFKKCLLDADLGLSRKDVNALMSEIDVDGSGTIDYTEFLPLCFNILVERQKDEMLTNETLRSRSALENELLDSFQEADTQGTSLLPRATVKQVLQELSFQFLGLTNLQIVTILAQARTTPDGSVNYVAFAPVAAAMIHTMVDLLQQKQRADAILRFAQTGSAQAMRSMNPGQIKELMLAAFKEADVAASGTLSRDETITVLLSLGASELALSTSEVNALISAIDGNEDGQVQYAEVVDFMYDVLAHLEREAFIQSVAYTTGAAQEPILTS